MPGRRLFVGLWGLCCAACTTTLYKPNQAAVPLLRERGELRASASANDLQTAYAAGSHVGLLANGYRDTYDKEARHASGWLAEGGVGLFGGTPVRNLVWESYIGLGGGRVRADDRLDDGQRPVGYRAHGLRAFLQPNVGYVTPWFELALSARLSEVNFTHLEAFGYSADERAQSFLEPGPVTSRLWTFFEPAVTVKGGYKWVKLFYQRGWAFKLGGGPLPHDDRKVTVGIALELAHWYDTFAW